MPLGSEDVTIPITDGPDAMAAGASTLPIMPPAVISSPPAPPETVYFSRAGVRISSVTIAASGAEIALQDVRAVVAGVVPPGRKVEFAVGGLGATALLLGLLLRSISTGLTAVVIVCTTLVVALRRAHVPAVNIECIDGRVYTVNVPDPAVAEEICSASYQARMALPPPQMYSAADAAGRPGA